jgi:hypothetical protein
MSDGKSILTQAKFQEQYALFDNDSMTADDALECAVQGICGMTAEQIGKAVTELTGYYWTTDLDDQHKKFVAAFLEIVYMRGRS